MKAYHYFVTIILIWSTLSISACKQEQVALPMTGEIEFYLIDSFETELNSFKIDESTIVLANEVFVEYEDILDYNTSTYTFTLSQKANEAISNADHSVRGLAYAVVADGELVYSAYFWPSYSSLSCDWVVADPTGIDIFGKLRVRIGYPGTPPDSNIPDRRNAEILTNIFKRDGKLSE